MKCNFFINHRLHLLGAMSFLSLLFTPLTWSQNNSLAKELLARMSDAVSETNYQGKFIYEVANSELETFSVIHRVVNGEEFESLERLNGREQIIQRELPVNECNSTADQILRGRLGAIQPSDRFFNNYSLYLRGEQRVAGRETYVIHLVPRDRYRNGQIISIDQESFIPVKKQWFSPDNKLIERLQYIELEINPDFAESTADSNAVPIRVQDDICPNSNPDGGPTPWQLNWLPSGFFLTKVARTTAGEAMLSYTDGLASFSVFVKEQPVNVALAGTTNRGATIAYVGNRVWNQSPYRVIVIGEIPLLTAQKLVEGIQPSTH